VKEAIALVPIEQRKTLRKLKAATGIPLSTLHAMKEDKEDSVICSHWNALKPHLQDHHKFARVLYTVANLDLDTDEFSAYFNFIQDGASSHIKQNDPAFVDAATQGNWNITLLTQPAQSPDTNLLDLTFFRALQSKQWDNGFENEINGLIAQVLRANNEFLPRKIDFGFLTLASCMDEILCSNGDNIYSIPHMGKERLLQAGTLPVRVTASPNAIAVARLVMGVDAHSDVDDDSDDE
jgi:hypothetical protein